LIFGLGTDIIEVDRVRKTLEGNAGLLYDLFSPAEIEYCEAKAQKYQHYAARFCAKEAFLKALGTGLSAGIKPNQIEVLNEPSGKPFIRLTGTAKSLTKKYGFSKILVSLSHIREISKAVVIIETDE